MDLKNKRTSNVKEGGITLIALVVTIIVLLVLAGVTINLVLNDNGILQRAKSSVNVQEKAIIEQEIEHAKGYAETYRQTGTGSFLDKVKEYLENSESLSYIGEVSVTAGNKNGQSFLIVSVGALYNFKVSEDGTVEWLENAEVAADELRPEIVNLASGDVSFSFSPSTPTQGNVTVTITENDSLDKKGNNLQYKIGTTGTYQNYTAPFPVSDNCTIYAALYNGKDYGTTLTGEVSNIDKTAPTSVTFTKGEVTENSITVTATASDTKGIKYFDFSSDGGSTYPTANRKTIANVTTGAKNQSFTFTGLNPGTSYTVRVKATDEAGNSLQSSTEVIQTENPVSSYPTPPTSITPWTYGGGETNECSFMATGGTVAPSKTLAGYQYKFDNGSWSQTVDSSLWGVFLFPNCTSDYYYSPHIIHARTVDSDGNVSEEISEDAYMQWETCCFDADSQVQMADGSTKNIIDVNPGDVVMSLNVDSGEFVPQKVDRKIIKPKSNDLVYVHLSNGEKIGMRAYHPLLSTQGWKSLRLEIAKNEIEEEVSLLELGDELVGYNENAKVIKIEQRPEISNYYTYNLSIEGWHNYIANGIVVHNARCPVDYPRPSNSVVLN